MAEVALPLLGLGFLYVISNKDKEKKENFTNINNYGVHEDKYLPNTHVS